MSDYYSNKRCMEEIANRLTLADERVNKDVINLKNNQKSYDDPYLNKVGIENILHEKQSCIKHIDKELKQSTLSPETQKQIHDECKTLVMPELPYGMSGVDKFIDSMPKLGMNPEVNQLRIEKWASGFQQQREKDEQEALRMASKEHTPVTPSTTKEFNDKSAPSPQQLKKDFNEKSAQPKEVPNKRKDRERDD